MFSKYSLSIFLIGVTSLAHIEGFSYIIHNSYSHSYPVIKRLPVQTFRLYSSTQGDINEEVAKLRAAAQKAREEAQLLAHVSFTSYHHL